MQKSQGMKAVSVAAGWGALSCAPVAGAAGISGIGNSPMAWGSILVWLVPLLVAAAVLQMLASQGLGSRSYRALRLMTDNEIEFFGRLRRALPNHNVFPQVAMSALIAPKGMTNQSRTAAFRAISQKRVDYVVCDGSMGVVCVIELDDRTHNRSKDSVRDGYLASASIKTLRWESRSKPSVDAIREAVASIHAPSLKAQS